MDSYISKEVAQGLARARAAALSKHSRLRVIAGEDIFPVRRMWETGFAMDLEDAPKLRGLVDLFDGARHLYQCLVVASQDENGERSFEFKRRIAADAERAVDFERAEQGPVALIPET